MVLTVLDVSPRVAVHAPCIGFGDVKPDLQCPSVLDCTVQAASPFAEAGRPALGVAGEACTFRLKGLPLQAAQNAWLG